MTANENSKYATGLLSSVHEAAALRSLLVPTIPDSTPEYRREKLQQQRQKKRDGEIAYVHQRYAGCRLFVRLPAGCFTDGGFRGWFNRRNASFQASSGAPFFTGLQLIDGYYYFTVSDGYGVDPMLYLVNFVSLLQKCMIKTDDALMNGEITDAPFVFAELVRVPA